GHGPPGRVVPAGGPLHRAAQVVRARPGAVRGVRAPLPRRARPAGASGGAGPAAAAGAGADPHPAHRHQEPGPQPGRGARRAAVHRVAHYPGVHVPSVIWAVPLPWLPAESTARTVIVIEPSSSWFWLHGIGPIRRARSPTRVRSPLMPERSTT